jgi:hypothetical protein
MTTTIDEYLDINNHFINYVLPRDKLRQMIFKTISDWKKEVEPLHYALKNKIILDVIKDIDKDPFNG